MEKTQGTRQVVRSAVDVKSWLLEMPTAGKVRPTCCPVCKAASTPVGGRIVVQGHGKRPRQAWGPAAPHSSPAILALTIRRYRCLACRALTTVVPSETLTKRLYTAPVRGLGAGAVRAGAGNPHLHSPAGKPMAMLGSHLGGALADAAAVGGSGRPGPPVSPGAPDAGGVVGAEGSRASHRDAVSVYDAQP